MRKLAFLIPMFPLVTLAVCAPGEVDVAAEEMAVRQVDRAIVAAANAHGIEGPLEVFADDARMLPPNAPPVVGEDAIRDSPAA
jgi:ketosteroid isomerase-like protein